MSAFRSRQEKTTTAYDILPPAPVRRAQQKAREFAQDVVDAQFVTVGDTPRRPFTAAPRNDNRRTVHREAMAVSAQPGPIARVAERVETALMRMSADFFSAIVALVFVLVFGFAGGFSLIGGDAADAGQRRGLDITHVSLTPQDANGMQALLINGIIENGDAGDLHLPPIHAELVLGDRILADMLIAPPALTIGAGESRGFSARMPYAGGKKPQVRLSFVEKGAPRS